MTNPGLTYNNKWLTEKISRGYNPKYIFFWGHQPSASGVITQSCLSQWWPSGIEADGQFYPTAEHYMMAQKAKLFGDIDAFHETLKATKPAAVKEIGRSVRNFDPEIWDREKYNIVLKGNLLKFSADKDLRPYLCSTGERILVEASPVDKIWGIGMAADNPGIDKPENWKGSNLLGYALMEVRDILNAEAGAE